MDYAKISSDNIRRLAEQNKLSITQLAEAIGVAQTTLNAALKSKKGVPIETLIRISDFFGTTVPSLCGKENLPAHTDMLGKDTEVEKVKGYLIDLFVGMGFIEEGTDLSDADLEFAQSLFSLIHAYFNKR